MLRLRHRARLAALLCGSALPPAVSAEHPTIVITGARANDFPASREGADAEYYLFHPFPQRGFTGELTYSW